MVFRHNVHELKMVRRKSRQIRHNIDESLIKKHKKSQSLHRSALLWLEFDKCSD